MEIPVQKAVISKKTISSDSQLIAQQIQSKSLELTMKFTALILGIFASPYLTQCTSFSPLSSYAYDVQVPPSTTGFDYQQVSNVNFANPQPTNSFSQPFSSASSTTQQTQFGAQGQYIPMVGSGSQQTQIGGSTGLPYQQPSYFALNYPFQPTQQYFTQQEPMDSRLQYNPSDQNLRKEQVYNQVAGLSPQQYYTGAGVVNPNHIYTADQRLGIISNNRATGQNNNIAYGGWNTINNGRNNDIFGGQNSFLRDNADNTVVGNYNKFQDYSYQNVVFGNDNRIDGANMSVSGNANFGSGYDHRINGQFNSAYGSSQNVLGNGNKVYGSSNTVFQNNNAVNGIFNEVKGLDNIVTGKNNFVEGTRNTIKWM